MQSKQILKISKLLTYYGFLYRCYKIFCCVDYTSSGGYLIIHFLNISAASVLIKIVTSIDFRIHIFFQKLSYELLKKRNYYF